MDPGITFEEAESQICFFSNIVDVIDQIQCPRYFAEHTLSSTQP